jgi:hypothetical protein
MRGPSSKSTLEIDWRHPVYTPRPGAEGDGTRALPRREALSTDDAMAALTSGDRRPVLVLRECLKCSGTEDALMSSKEDNERTYLLARWFHCVKLSPDVLEPDHPFRNLFPGEQPSHLFIANPDGSARHDLAGEHSRRELWGAMEAALAASYQGGVDSALQKLGRILNDLDEIDRSSADLETRFELAIAADGADSPKVKKLRKELDDLGLRRTELLARADQAQALELGPAAPVEKRP